MKQFLHLTFLFLIGGTTGCSTAGHRATAPVHLTAVKLSPTDIQLNWNDSVTRNVAGHIVEWATETNGDYFILAFTRPDVTSFVHPDLAPETKCCYRIRPYFGPASNPVEITTGKAIANEEVKVADETWANPKITADGKAGAQFSIRNVSTVAQAAPTELKAKLIHPTGIQFTWIDHANDEEGFMLEMKTEADTDFHVCAIVEPNITSYGYAVAPPQTKISFRVRAFYYGTPSNVAQQMTGSAAFHAAKDSH